MESKIEFCFFSLSSVCETKWCKVCKNMSVQKWDYSHKKYGMYMCQFIVYNLIFAEILLSSFGIQTISRPLHSASTKYNLTFEI